MKIQLPLENWVDVFGFVPRLQLVELLPQIDDRHFAEAMHYFLQNVGRITLDNLFIDTPIYYEVNGRLMRQKFGLSTQSVRIRRRHLGPGPVTPMPENITNFRLIYLRYLDLSVINFLHRFHQNSLLQNVNLELCNIPTEKLLSFFTHILPLIDSIESVKTAKIHQLIQLCESPVENNNGLSRIVKTAMKQTRILKISGKRLDTIVNELGWCCRWLYTPRNDGRPRLLIFSTKYSDGISSIFDRMKQDFHNSNHAIIFFVVIYASKRIQLHEDISHKNQRTNELLSIKRVNNKTILISRYPSETTKEWIEENENEVLNWDVFEQDRKIELDELAQIAI